jgi:hypothetical protein
MSRPTVVISVYGGGVQDVFCSEPRAAVTVVDWDAEGTDHAAVGYVSVPDKFGRESLAIVSTCEAEPLAAMKNTPIQCEAEPLAAMKNTPIQAALKRAELLFGRA